MGSIQSIKTHLDTEDVPFLIVAFPTSFQLNRNNHPNIPQQILASRSSDSSISYIDILPIYEEACSKAGSAACEGYENLLFADVWMHLNTFGHQLAAEAIYDWQVRQ